MGIFDTAKLDAATIAGKKLTTLADRPNASLPYGNNLTSAELKAWFTSMVEYIGARYTALISALEALTAAGGIGATDNVTGLITSIQALFDKIFDTSGAGTEHIYFADNSITPVVATVKATLQDFKTRITTAESDISDIQDDNAIILAYLGGIDENGNISILDEMLAALEEMERLAGIASDLGNYEERIITLEEDKVNTSDIVDNLTSTDTDKPLSAKQGKVLKDEVDLKADKSDLTALYKFTGTVNSYDLLPSDLGEIATGSPSPVYNITTETIDPPLPAGANVAWNGTSWDDLGGSFVMPDIEVNGEVVPVEEGKIAITIPAAPVQSISVNGTEVTPDEDGNVDIDVITEETFGTPELALINDLRNTVLDVYQATEGTFNLYLEAAASGKNTNIHVLTYPTASLDSETSWGTKTLALSAGYHKIVIESGDGTAANMPRLYVYGQADADKYISCRYSNLLTSTGDYSLYNCINLVEFSCPVPLTVSQWSFTGCTSLHLVDCIISPTGGRAFQNCTALKNVNISELCCLIGYRTFYGCTALEEINLPASFSSMGQEAFSGCTSLRRITSASPEGTFIASSSAAFANVKAEVIGSSEFIGVFIYRNGTRLYPNGVDPVPKLTTAGQSVYGHTGSTQNELGVDTDGTLVANSDTKLPTQKAAKTYADTKVSKVTTGSLRRVYGVSAANAEESTEIETAPTASSTKLVTSGGIYTADAAVLSDAEDYCDTEIAAAVSGDSSLLAKLRFGKQIEKLDSTFTGNYAIRGIANRRISHGNYMWVAVGDNGLMMTATDPTGTWTSRTSSFGTDDIRNVFYGNGVWVAVGENGKIATATDPTSTWTQIENDFTGYVMSVKYFDSIWVAVGYNGELFTATDPTGTWTSRTSGFGTTHIIDVNFDGTYWIAVGFDGKIATATDPTSTWTSRTSGTSEILYGVGCGNGKCVVVGANGLLLTATDPTSTWTSRTSGFDTTYITKVAYGNGVWAISGNNTKLAIAIDPTGTWTLINQYSDASKAFSSINYGNGCWLIGGTALLNYAKPSL